MDDREYLSLCSYEQFSDLALVQQEFVYRGKQGFLQVQRFHGKWEMDQFLIRTEDSSVFGLQEPLSPFRTMAG